MVAPHTRRGRACDALLNVAAALVPHDIRRDWLREWRSELANEVWRAARKGTAEPSLVCRMLGRTSGAFVHAAWLRWDRWRGEMLLQDLKYAFRTLVRRPGFALVVIATLALGIGANAAIFSAARAVLLRPLPFPEPDRIVQVFQVYRERPSTFGVEASPPDFADWRQDNRSFVELAAINAGSFPLTGDGQVAEQLAGASVTGGFFTVLGVPPRLGRTLLVEDDPPNAPAVAVLSHAVWQRRFGGEHGVVGRIISLDGVPTRIVGVMPRGFSYPLGSEVWMPLRFTERDLTTQRGAHYLDVIARLQGGTTLESARADMRVIGDRLAQAYPRTNRATSASVHPLHEVLFGPMRPALLMLLGAVGFVLLIVCVNVASLVLTRALGRTRELMVCAALGAGRARLVRGLLVESLLIGVASGVAGLLVAWWVGRGIAALPEGLGIPRIDETSIDGAVVAFTGGLALAAALVFGTLPAWHVSNVRDVARGIREDSGTLTGTRHRQRLRAGLIVAEVALAVVLLIGAGLLVQSFVRLTSVELGLDPSRVQTFNVSLPEIKYDTPDKRAAFIDTLVARLASLPAVEAAGAIFGMPLTDFGYRISTSTLDGRALDDEEQDRRMVQVRVVTPDYFRALGIPILRGRALAAGDRRGALPVVMVSEAAARMYWGDEDPLGRRFELGTRMGQGGERAGGTVVGVARDVHDHGPAASSEPTVYLAHAQFPVDFVTVAIKRAGDPSSSVEPARALLGELDADVPMYRVRTMGQLASDAVAQPRLYALLLALFAGGAVLLAALGIYGVLVHAVSQRTREIGIRLALGAGRGEVVGMIVRHAGGLALAGLLIGVAIALGTTRLMRSLLFGIEPTDLATYAMVIVALLAVALAASWLPARRAAGIDPVRALRYE